ncbi:PAC2 family protein [Mobilicoccus massiliensis]|uniref:PAC2 family protein n=1 Tax=Mobilicoccus massiliensis TaxID=1522310 RepID=UPI000590DB41|nr:PAC2 family protein [Mobilicoccus massiliensis]
MIEVEDLPELRRPIVVAAFEGWNDAGEAASSVIAHLADVWGAEAVAAVDPEDYYDFQVNRPRVGPHEGIRRITWPTTRILLARDTGFDHDVLLVQGIEPSMRWRAFVIELLTLAHEVDAELLVCLGALLADVPHTRPCPVFTTAEDPELIERYGLEESTYEGHTGILGVLADAAHQSDLPCVSSWVSVPHYAGGHNSPKATLALLNALESLLDLALPHGDLEDLSRAWERGVDELAGSDEEIGEYVQALESAQDTADRPEASGDAIAAEFERYLRRRGNDQQQGG